MNVLDQILRTLILKETHGAALARQDVPYQYYADSHLKHVLQPLHLSLVAHCLLPLNLLLEHQSSDVHQDQSMVAVQPRKHQHPNSINQLANSFALTSVH